MIPCPERLRPLPRRNSSRSFGERRQRNGSGLLVVTDSDSGYGGCTVKGSIRILANKLHLNSYPGLYNHNSDINVKAEHLIHSAEVEHDEIRVWRVTVVGTTSEIVVREEVVMSRSDEIMASSCYHVSVKDRGAVPPLEGALDHDGRVPLLALGEVRPSLIAVIDVPLTCSSLDDTAILQTPNAKQATNAHVETPMKRGLPTDRTTFLKY
jgi:hypothetical protein